MAEQAFSDVKVLDLTWYIAGPYCTKMLADYGADVLKVERPAEGDPSRKLGPFLNDEPDPEKSALFSHLNTNKKGITLDLKSEWGRKVIEELVKDVDILVESFRLGVMERLGLDYETLNRINPKLVMTRISNFGQTGPYRDYKMSELTLNAMGAEMYSCGWPENPPEKRGANCLQYQVGLTAALATVGGLFVARQQGIGQYIDVSAMETMAGCIDWRTLTLLSYAYSGEVFVREETLGLIIWPSGAYPCKDGFVRFLAMPQWGPRLAKMMDMPDLLEQFPNPFDMMRKDDFDAIFRPWCLEQTKMEVMEKAQEARVAGTAIQTPEEVVNDPQFNFRGFWTEIEHPVTGKQIYPGAPFKMQETPWAVRMPAPLLGEHNEEIYCKKLLYTEEHLVKLKERGVI